MKMFVSAFVGVAVMLSGWGCAQEEKPDFHERVRLESAFSSFSECLQSKRARCVASAVSVQGVVIGVDERRLSKNAVARGLATDTALQCLFWGTRCGSKKSSECPIMSLATGSPQYGKAYFYRGNWQAEVRTKAVDGMCPFETAFIFQLEKGFWRVKAVPYS